MHFIFLADLSWGEPAKRGCEKKDDEAGMS